VYLGRYIKVIIAKVAKRTFRFGNNARFTRRFEIRGGENAGAAERVVTFSLSRFLVLKPEAFEMASV